MRLPVSGLEVSFRLPDGRDDLDILESRMQETQIQKRQIQEKHRPDRHGPRRSMSARVRNTSSGEDQAEMLERCLRVLRRLVPLKQQEARELSEDRWESLTITDFEFALLGLRGFLFGDSVRCVVRCACNERMEIEFSIADLLREGSPRTPRRVTVSPTRAGWFELGDAHGTQQPRRRFRLPTVGDQMQALRSPDAYRFLQGRCIESPEQKRRGLADVERAMESMSPSISRTVTGMCAACGTRLNSQLHVPSLVLGELRAASAEVHREIHAIAAAYHWDEISILAMPQLRRQAYLDAMQQAGAR